MVITDILRPSSNLGLAPTPRALLTTSLATLDSSLELGLCLDSSPGLMELQEASMLTPTAGCSQARARPTPGPLSDDEDKEMELVKHFRLPLLLCNL